MTEDESDQTVFVLLATVAPLLSGLIPLLCLQASQGRFFRWMLALSAGLLLGIGTLDLIPEALQLALKNLTENGVSGGTKTGIDSFEHLDHHDAHEINQRLSVTWMHPVRVLLRATKQCLKNMSWASLNHKEQLSDEDVETNHEHGHRHIHEPSVPNVMVGIFMGYMVLLTLEKLFMGHHSHGTGKRSGSDGECDDHSDHRKGSTSLSSGFSYTVFLAFIVHSFADGFLISGGFESSHSIGTRVALAVVSHKFPDGFVLASVVGTRTNVTKKMGLLMIVGVSFMTPIGSVIGHFILHDITPSALGFILAYGAGNFLYISLTAIIPEIMEAKKHRVSSILLIATGPCSHRIVAVYLTGKIPDNPTMEYK